MDQPGSARRFISSSLRKGMLFSIGSMLVFQERMAEFVEDAIERGQTAQEEGRGIVQERRAMKKGAPKVKHTLDTRITDAFKRLNVPTRQDVKELDQHVALLAQRIDELKSSR